MHVPYFQLRMSSSIEGKRSRLVAIDALIQFIECCVHAFLFTRSLYPRPLFRSHQRLGQSVWMCDLKDVRKYVKEFATSLRTCLLLDRIQSVVVGMKSSSGSSLEKFIIELPNDFARSVFYALPSTASRSDLDIAGLASEVLRDCFTHIERKLRISPIRDKGDTWELLAITKRAPEAHQNDPVDVPGGFDVVPVEESGGYWERTRDPIKSVMIGDGVVVSTYLDAAD